MMTLSSRSTSPNFPLMTVVAANPTAGVALTFPVYSRAVTAIATLSNTRHVVLLIPIFFLVGKTTGRICQSPKAHIDS